MTLDNYLTIALQMSADEIARLQRQPGKLESFFAVTKSLIIRALIIYFVSTFFRKPATTPTAPDANNVVPAGPKITAWNYFENGIPFDLFVYVSEDFDFNDFDRQDALVWHASDLAYGDWTAGPNQDGIFTYSTKIYPSEKVRNNGSIYIHSFVVKSGQSPDPGSGSAFAGKNMGYSRRLLNKFKKVKRTKTHNLLTGVKDEDTSNEILMNLKEEGEYLSHWHPNLTINLVTDQTNWSKGAVPQPLDDYIQFLPGGHTYLPIIFFNDYWNMQRDYM